MVRFDLDRRQTAVLVVDVQVQFADPSGAFAVPAAAELLPRLARFLGAVRELGVPVLYTEYRQRDGLPPSPVAAALFPAVREGRAHRGSAVAVHPAVAPAPGDYVIAKPRQSAFYGTDLEPTLRVLGVQTLIICGLTTNVCCLASARDAAARDLQVVFLSDLTATFDLPSLDGGVLPAAAVQEMTCAIVAHSIGEVATGDEVLARLAR